MRGIEINDTHWKLLPLNANLRRQLLNFLQQPLIGREEPENQNGPNPKSLGDQGETMCQKVKQKRRGKIEKAK